MITQDQADWFRSTFDLLVQNVEQAVVGKEQAVRLSLTCLLSQGHLLLEDIPGTGKTSLAKAIANTLQGTHARIQFTPDLLPGDVTGVQVFNPQQGTFDFHPGPIFASIVVADEINRASPKTQAALLQVMEENRVSVDGVDHAAPDPFMVIATQNPIEQAGTYRLPEAQLDRFLMRTKLDHPDHEVAIQILEQASLRDRSVGVGPQITPKGVIEMSGIAAGVHTDRDLLAYVDDLATATRPSSTEHVRLGVSMRGSMAMVRAAKTWAASQGRTFVLPDDVKALAIPIFTHRIVLAPESEFAGWTPSQVVLQALQDVPSPVGAPA
jgi:MoxR-like ATPase